MTTIVLRPVPDSPYLAPTYRIFIKKSMTGEMEEGIPNAYSFWGYPLGAAKITAKALAKKFFCNYRIMKR